MIYRVMNDLHLDWHLDLGKAWLEKLPDVPCDAIIVAGDIGHAACLGRCLENFCCRFPDKKVIFVPGNHDYWGGEVMASMQIEYAEYRNENLRVLDPDWTYVGDQLVVGTPGWYMGEPLPADRQIAGPATQKIIEAKCQDSVEFLDTLLNDKLPPVVVTHYLPHEASISPKFRSGDNHGFFNPLLADLLKRRLCRLWVHGHTHDSCDYYVNETRVVCNPYGYHGYEVNPNWDPQLCVFVA